MDLFRWSTPIFGTEREKGEVLDPQFGTVLHDRTHRFDPAPVPLDSGQTPRLSPAAITVHDDRDMARDLANIRYR